MKKLLFVVPTWNLGGTEKVNVAVAEALSKNYAVDLVTLSTPDKSLFHSSVNLEGKSTAQYQWFLRLAGLSGLLKLKAMVRFFIQRQSKFVEQKISKTTYDTVIFSGPAILLIPFIKNRGKTKLIAWCHNSATRYLGGYFRYTTEFLTDGLCQADKVICLTSQDMTAFSRFNANISVLHNPITIKADKVSDLVAPVISWTGRLDNPHKGLDYLAEIASLLPEGWRISVAGKGNLPLFRKWVRRFKVEDKISYRGSLTGEALKKHYGESSIYLMTSRWEGLPLVLIEAMSFGLPIVAFEQSGSSEVLENGDYGLLAPNGDVHALFCQLKKLIEDSKMRALYQQKSLQRVKDFEMHQIIQEWDRLLNED
ncbi:MAG: glycosyltransferase [Streptococcaceae bacterium]|jgi:glycosyltransferase involved in cell wall biosynthesis|nr:glycosyltransferase [Streptococcaceae bacterium]